MNEQQYSPRAPRASAQFMRDYLQRAPAPSPIQHERLQAQSPKNPDQPDILMNDNELIFMGYDSNLESDDESLMGEGEDSVDGPELRVSESDEPPAKRI